MTTQLPTWNAFQPDAPPSLPSGRGHVVALVCLPGAGGGTGAKLATGLARAWSEAGNRVVLADLGLSAPSLHEVLGVENQDGVSDAVGFGASVGLVARPIEGEPFFFIAAGTAVANPESFLEHARWAALCQGFQEAEATLVAFVPAGAETRSQVLAQATDVVLLGGPGDEPGPLEAEVEDRVRAFLGGSETTEAVSGEEEAEEEVVSLAALAPDEPGGPPGEPEMALAGDAAEEERPAGTEVETTVEETGVEEEDFSLEPDDLPAASEAGTEVETAVGETEVEEEDFSLEPDGLPVASGVGGAASGGEGSPEGDFTLAEEEAEPEAAGDDFALAEEQLPKEPAATESQGTAGAHGRVPLADEILAEAGDAPEPAVQMGEGPAPSPGAHGSTGASRGRRSFLLLLLLLAVAGAAAAWWLGYVEIPGLTRPGAPSTSSAEPAESLAPLAAAEPVVETAPSAAWAVAVEAHGDQETAWSRVEALRAAVPGHLWFAAPVDVEGTLFHRVLVGTVAREPLAEALRQQVAEELGADPTDWVLRATPLAWRLGETDTLEEARERVDAFRGEGIPAYVLAVSYSDGSQRFRLYAGAYADGDEARGLGALLDQRGMTDKELTERTGRLPE